MSFFDLCEQINSLNWDFSKKLQNGVCNLSLFEEDEGSIEDEKYTDYTKKNTFYVYIGYLTLKYSGKYILRYFLDTINASIVEVENNYQNFNLNEEDKIKILNLAKQVKEGLPKLKIFETSTELIDLEIKEYLESQQK